jgi:membrane protease YdiL (CAAX protease family)
MIEPLSFEQAGILTGAALASIALGYAAVRIGRSLESSTVADRAAARIRADWTSLPGWINAAGFGVVAVACGLSGIVIWLLAAFVGDFYNEAFFATQVMGNVTAEVAAILLLTGGRPGLLALRAAPAWMFGLAFGLTPLFLGVSALWDLAVEAMGGSQQQMVLQMLSQLPAYEQAAAAVLIGILIPLLEELLFRGAWFTRLQSQIGDRWSIALTGVAFGLLHMETPWAVPLLAVMGVTLGWLRAKSGSLWPSFVLHALNNTVAVALVLTGYAG